MMTRYKDINVIQKMFNVFVELHVYQKSQVGIVSNKLLQSCCVSLYDLVSLNTVERVLRLNQRGNYDPYQYHINNIWSTVTSFTTKVLNSKIDYIPHYTS